MAPREPGPGVADAPEPRQRPARWLRIARIVALAIILGVGISQVVLSVQDWHLRDMNAYWDAGLRVRFGEPLYPSGVGIEASETYRYSPWFAWVWAPVTLLPRLLANVLWSAVLLAASAAAMVPLLDRRAWTAAALFFPILVGISAIGNAHPLLIAALVLGVDRRSGPVWIAVAASIKLAPILLVLTYVGRRQWWRAGATLFITALLLAPLLLYDLSHYVTDAGGAALLFGYPPVYAVTVLAAGGGAIWLAKSRYRWLASSLTVVLALPRFFIYDITYLSVGLAAWKASHPASGAHDE